MNTTGSILLLMLSATSCNSLLFEKNKQFQFHNFKYLVILDVEMRKLTERLDLPWNL